MVPFHYVGLVSNRSVSAPLLPLHSYYIAVRACYPAPAGCYDPVMSDGLAVDSVAPAAGKLVAAYSEAAKALTVTVTATWDHFQEVNNLSPPPPPRPPPPHQDYIRFISSPPPSDLICSRNRMTQLSVSLFQTKANRLTSEMTQSWVLWLASTSGHWPRHQPASVHTFLGGQ